MEQPIKTIVAFLLRYVSASPHFSFHDLTFNWWRAGSRDLRDLTSSTTALVCGKQSDIPHFHITHSSLQSRVSCLRSLTVRLVLSVLGFPGPSVTSSVTGPILIRLQIKGHLFAVLMTRDFMRFRRFYHKTMTGNIMMRAAQMTVRLIWAWVIRTESVQKEITMVSPKKPKIYL
jgi:hypothetical protein